MENLIYILFICLAVPLALTLFILPKKSRLVVVFLLIGVVVALFVSEINTILLNAFDNDMVYVTTTITPITEELIKAIPILVYALLFSNKQEVVAPIALSLGIGFGMFENMTILVQNISSITIGWAVIRGFSTALMHGMCTLLVGYGICFVRKVRKLFYCGTFALLFFAFIYHGIFNMLVQSDYRYFAFVLPVITYIPLIVILRKSRTKAKKKEIKPAA